MWEVIAKSPVSGRECKRVVTHWSRVEELRDKAFAMGWRFKTKKYYCDVLVADAMTGDFVVAAEKLSPDRAARFARDWNRLDRNSGCLLWPHGVEVPAGWKVLR